MSTAKAVTARSRVTNGASLYLQAIDGRSLIARRFRDLYAQLIEDAGGSERLSEGQRQIARRCAMLAVEAERMEAEAAKGEPFDLEAYNGLTNTLGRALQRLGLRRTARDVTPPDPLDYARSRAREASA